MSNFFNSQPPRVSPQHNNKATWPTTNAEKDVSENSLLRSLSPFASSSTLTLKCLLVGSIVIFTSGLPSVVNGAPAQSTRPDPVNCTNHLDTIDRCSSLSTYSFVTSFNPYPRNANELKQSCQRINDGLKCLKIQGKCLSSVTRRSLQSFANGRSRHSKKLCANPDGDASKKFYQTFDCILKNKGAEFTKSERDIIQSIEAITKSKLSWKDRFNHACCAASNFKERSLKDIGPQCTAFRSTAEEMIDSIVGELLDTACPDQQRLRQVCPSLKKLEPLTGTWKVVSLTRAALELVIVLSSTSGEDV